MQAFFIRKNCAKGVSDSTDLRLVAKTANIYN